VMGNGSAEERSQGISSAEEGYVCFITELNNTRLPSEK